MTISIVILFILCIVGGIVFNFVTMILVARINTQTSHIKANSDRICRLENIKLSVCVDQDGDEQTTTLGEFALNHSND